MASAGRNDRTQVRGPRVKQPGAQDFLIDRLRAERFLDPDMMATLLVLRRRLIDEYGTESAADLTLIDVAVQTSPDDPYLWWQYRWHTWWQYRWHTEPLASLCGHHPVSHG